MAIRFEELNTHYQSRKVAPGAPFEGHSPRTFISEAWGREFAHQVNSSGTHLLKRRFDQPPSDTLAISTHVDGSEGAIIPETFKTSSRITDAGAAAKPFVRINCTYTVFCQKGIGGHVDQLRKHAISAHQSIQSEHLRDCWMWSHKSNTVGAFFSDVCNNMGNRQRLPASNRLDDSILKQLIQTSHKFEK